MQEISKKIDRTEKHIKELEKTNLYVTIIEDMQTDENGENIYDDVSKHIYSNVPDGKEIQYDFMLEGGSKEYIYDYNIHSLLGALNSSEGFFENTDAWEAAEIKNIVLDTANGLFYVSTDVGYFLCDSVVIREDGARYD